jgi:hypothetical protein
VLEITYLKYTPQLYGCFKFYTKDAKCLINAKEPLNQECFMVGVMYLAVGEYLTFFVL